MTIVDIHPTDIGIRTAREEHIKMAVKFFETLGYEKSPHLMSSFRSGRNWIGICDNTSRLNHKEYGEVGKIGYPSKLQGSVMMIDTEDFNIIVLR